MIVRKFNNGTLLINICIVLKYYDTILVLKINTYNILCHIKILVCTMIYCIIINCTKISNVSQYYQNNKWSRLSENFRFSYFHLVNQPKGISFRSLLTYNTISLSLSESTRLLPLGMFTVRLTGPLTWKMDQTVEVGLLNFRIEPDRRAYQDQTILNRSISVGPTGLRFYNRPIILLSLLHNFKQ